MSKPSARIALLLQDFAGGGAERIMVNVAEGLNARGHVVDIVVIRHEGPFLDRVPRGVVVRPLGARRVSRSIPAIARYLREHRPQAALSTLVHMNVATVIACRLARVSTRVVVREANLISENARSDPRSLIRLAYRLLPWAYSRADHVIAISESLATEVREVSGIPAQRVTAIHNPVLSSRDLEGIEAISAPPHPWLGGTGIPVILSVGRLVPQKGHATLLEAFSKLRETCRARLVIVGDGPLKRDLLARSEELGISDDVIFPGFTADPYSWMKFASVLAHTSRWEGFGNVIVEALACGLPVVATDCPGGPREILADGRFGRLVSVGDVQAVAKALGATLDAPPPPELLRGRAAAFTVEAIMPRYEEILLGPIGAR